VTLRLSPSQAARFRECKRSFWFDYHLSLTTPPKTGAASWGTGFHAAVAGEDVHAYYAERMAEASPAERMDILKEKKGVLAVSAAYAHHAKTADAGIEVVAREIEFEVVIGEAAGEEVSVYGFIDLLYRDDDGQLVVRDYKTCTRFELPEPLAISQQLLTYVLAIYVRDGELARGEYEMVKRSQGTGRATTPQYQRFTQDFTLATVEQHRRHLLSAAEDIIVTKQRLAGGGDHQVICPPGPNKNCGWKCALGKDEARLCAGLTAGTVTEDDLRAQFVPRERRSETPVTDAPKAA
jgi:RecB family exonuclease